MQPPLSFSLFWPFVHFFFQDDTICLGHKQVYTFYAKEVLLNIFIITGVYTFYLELFFSPNEFSCVEEKNNLYLKRCLAVCLLEFV